MRTAPSLPPEPAAGAVGSQGAPLIAHVIYRLDVGGLENGLVNLINRISAQRFRHAIISLTDSSEFRQRLTRGDVPVRIHGEHGRDVDDLDGTNTRRQIVRRLYKPFVHQYIAVSQDLGSYLQQKIGVPHSRIAQIYNGVDSTLFHPAGEYRDAVPHPNFSGPGHFTIGTVGRMQEVKDPLTLARAFVRLMQAEPGAEQRLRLVMVGDGPLRERVLMLLAEAGVDEYAWLPGESNDVARIMRSFDLFVLPSLAEGISNTILEAMASGLPVLATAVGGNPELIQAGVTGTLVPRNDAESMARAMRAYAESAELCRRHGSEARRAVERRFGMEAMVNAYMAVYDNMLASTTRRIRT
jgi:sugar transferase (PEP-CTERM/EpsH1 system associated)